MSDVLSPKKQFFLSSNKNQNEGKDSMNENNMSIEKKELTLEEQIGIAHFLEENDSEQSLSRNKMLLNFTASLKHLLNAVATENDLLSKNDFSRLKEIHNSKTRGLHNLNLSINQILDYKNENQEEDKEIKKALESALSYLRENLKKNESLLASHLEAVTELSSVIKKAVKADETDGTYGPFKKNIEKNL